MRIGGMEERNEDERGHDAGPRRFLKGGRAALSLLALRLG
jgi:hypothetical protein